MTLKAAMRSSQHNKFWRIPRRKSSAALFHYVQSPPQLRKQCGSMVAMRVDGAATDPSLPLFGCRFRHFSSNDARSQAVSDTEEEESTPVVRRSPTKNKKNGHLAGAFAELAKARLSALVVGTTAAGFLAAGPYPLASDPTALAAVLMGTALCSSSAAAFNQIMEIEQDRKMKRTQHRPLVTGRLTQPQAMIAATSWSAGGTALLWLGTDPLTTALGAANIILYAGIYTKLKPISIANTWVGALVGAVPPVMGYTAAMYAGSGTTAALSWGSVLLDPVALTLGATLYLWQLPHFMALSYMYRADYTRGGFAMVPCHTITGADSAHVAEEQTAKIIVRYAWYLAAVPVVATVFNVTSTMFALEGMILNAYALTVAHRFYRDRTNPNARKIFITSLWYLPCTLMLFLLHSKTWDDSNVTTAVGNNNVLAQFLSDQIHAARNKGRELCLHEQSSVHNNSQACPVVLGTEKTMETVDRATQTLNGQMLPVVERLTIANVDDDDTTTRAEDD